MKKLVIVFILLLLTVGVSAQELALDEAIERAARNIEQEMPQRALILVLNVASPSEDFSRYVLDELTDHLVIGRKVSVVDRQNLAAIRAETNFQYSGEVSDESMVSIGKMLGAHYILTGSLNQRGINYRLRFRIISVETARIITSVILDIRKDAQVSYLIGDVSAQEMERQQRREQQQIEQSLKTANVRNNWLSIGVTGAGIGLRYERMLNAKMALGADVYFNIIGVSLSTQEFAIYNDFGADATLRIYPFGKIFYIGTGLGFHFGDGDSVGNYDREFLSGFAVSPELGFKIDLFKSGGFFLDIGVKVPLLIVEDKGLVINIVPYVGVIGWAF